MDYVCTQNHIKKNKIPWEGFLWSNSERENTIQD
jgi:hypothetical protein